MVDQVNFKKKYFLLFLSICCILLSVQSVIAVNSSNYSYIYFIFFISFIFLVAGVILDNFTKLIYILFAIIPLSIPVNIFNNDTEIQFPSEYIIGLVCFIIFINIKAHITTVKKIAKHPISIILLIEISWMILCSATSQLKLVSLKFTFIRICYVLAFYFTTIIWLKKRNNPLLLYIIYGIGMIVPIIYTLSEHSVYGFKQAGAYIITKPFYNDHTVYGACIAFIIPPICSLIFNKKHFFKSSLFQVFLVALLLLLIVAEYFSFSRAAWLSLAACLLLLFLIRIGMNGKQFLIITAFIALILSFNINTVLNKISDNSSISNKENLVTQIKSITNTKTDASNKERINRWKCAVRMFFEKPILGFGPRTYKFYYGNYQTREDMTYISTFNGTKGHAHSDYLSYLCETGAPGFMIHCVLYLAVIYFAINYIKNTKDRKKKVIATSVLLSFFTFVVHGIFNGFMEEDKMASLVFYSMAILVFQIEKEKTECEKKATL
jgi:O-antigen ligase